MTNAVITGWGKCLPPAVLTNHDLAAIMDTSDEWIVERTGIRERRVSHTNVAEMATVAAKRAVAAAGISGADVDLVILATASPDTVIPNNASAVQLGLGAKKAAAFDLNAGCSGFIYSLGVASSLITAGLHEKIVIIGAEHLTWYLDWSQRDTAVLFGDGAGAVVIQKSDEDAGLLSHSIGCQPEAADALKIANFGTDAHRFTTDLAELSVMFDGREIFKRAVTGMARASKTVLKEAGLTCKDIQLLIPHQANRRIMEAAANRLDVPDGVLFMNIEKYGNTSAATIPVALAEALEQGRITPGCNVLFAAFGAGLTWAAAVLRWGQRVTPLRTSDAELPPCDKTARQILDEAIRVTQNKGQIGVEF